jgi:parallel beta-helix repeat protein
VQGYNCENSPKPLISGAASAHVPSSAWTLDTGSSHIYYATLSSVADIKRLYVDNDFLRLARHPNSGWLTASSTSPISSSCQPAGYEPPPYRAAGYTMSLHGHNLVCSIVDSALPLLMNAVNLADTAGAGIHFRSEDYWIDDNIVSTVDSSGTIELQYRARFPLRAGWGYYLENRPWMFDQAGEWIFNKTTHTLYVWMPDGDAPGDRVAFAERDFGILAYRIPTLAINGIAITNTASDAVFVGSVPGVTLTNLTITNAGRNGIGLDRVSPATVHNSTIANTFSNGIQVGNTARLTISDNVLTAIGTKPMQLGSPVGGFAAIANLNPNTLNDSTITGNTIQGTSFYGILSALKGSVQYNTITESCMLLDDCGAIYVNGFGNATAAPATFIRYNAVNGVPGNRILAPLATTATVGIYIDHFANNVTVTQNGEVAGADYGILLHKAHDNSVTYNTLSNNRQVQLLLSSTTGGNAINHNEIHSRSDVPYLGLWTEDTAIAWSSSAPGSNQAAIQKGFGYYDYNNYHNAGSSSVVQLIWYYSSTQRSTLAFTDWQNQALQDLNGGTPAPCQPHIHCE